MILKGKQILKYQHVKLQINLDFGRKNKKQKKFKFSYVKYFNILSLMSNLKNDNMYTENIKKKLSIL